MKSRTVTKQGYYECEFNSNGVFLTEISGPDASANIGGPWYYMMPGQYVEGTSYLTSMVKTEALTSVTTVTTASQRPGYVTYTNNTDVPTFVNIPSIWNISPPSSQHICSDFKWYYGFVEHYEYCVTCEKKK